MKNFFKFKYNKYNNNYSNGYINFYPKFDLPNFKINITKRRDGSKKISSTGTITTLLSLLFSPLIFINIWIIIPIIMLFSIGWGEYFYEYDDDTWDEDMTKTYGFYFYNHNSKFIPTSFVIYTNRNRDQTGTKSFDMPWSYEWVRTSHLCKNGEWYHETKGNQISWEERDEIRKDFWKETYDYKYILKSDERQMRKATIEVEEVEWRPRWFKWIKLFNKVQKSIKIEFDDGVGERTGSWKGGTIGCGYDMIDNETPLECLRRMEKERSF